MELLVNIDVEDLEQAIEFYRAAHGLRLRRRLFENSAAELEGAGTKIYLLAKPAGSPTSPRATQRRNYQRHWTPVHVDFVVENVEAAVERAVAAGGTLENEISSHSWGRIATLSDPFGNGFCVLEFSQARYSGDGS